ncbi:MAG TPA: hypothetical protein ENI95_09180 [Chloroflexi bacterium]|nr:hypothetical protein [Chloroflexota bacterium]
MNDHREDWEEVPSRPGGGPPYPENPDNAPLASLPPWLYAMWVVAILGCLGGPATLIVDLLLGTGVGLGCTLPLSCGSAGLLVVALVLTLVALDQIRKTRQKGRPRF